MRIRTRQCRHVKEWREAGEQGRLRAFFHARQPSPGSRDRLCRDAEPFVELRCDGRGPKQEVDLDEALQAPRLEIARPGQQLLAVPHERLRVEHRRVLEADAGGEQASVVELLRCRTGPVVRIRGDEEPNAHPASDRATIALLVPLIAALLGLFIGFRMTRLPEPEPSGAAEGMVLG
jgi:hypothetical protein